VQPLEALDVEHAVETIELLNSGKGEAMKGEKEEEAEVELVAPAVRLQPPLAAKDRTQRRTESEQLARDRNLVQVQVRLIWGRGGAWEV
jgi:hypothetical protein